jgi:hypothetical protein
MKTTLLSLAVAAALSATSFAHAADAVGESVKINAPVGYHIEPQQFAEYEYLYKLSNGDQMRFTRQVGVFYTAVKGSPKVRIYPTGPGEFVTSAGTKMKFTEDGDKLIIDNYERLPMAARLPANTMVVATR